MKIKTIFVDIGGVLVRTKNTNARKIWEKKLGLKPRQLTHEIYKVQPAAEATVGLVTADKIWQNIAHKYSLNDSESNALRKDFFAGDKLNEAFYKYVVTLHKKYKIALFTNAWDDARTTNIQKFHLDKICDNMIISSEVKMRKPHKKIFKLALNLMNTTAGESVFIDDTMENIRVGREMGLHSIHFIHTKPAIDQIRRLL